MDKLGHVLGTLVQCINDNKSRPMSVLEGAMWVLKETLTPETITTFAKVGTNGHDEGIGSADEQEKKRRH